MDKLAVGPEAADVDRHRRPVDGQPRSVAKARASDVATSPPCILDRPRHEDLIQRGPATGARIRLITDGDVAGAIWPPGATPASTCCSASAARPRAMIAACALKCIGGAIQGRLWPRNDDERRQALDAGYDLDQVLTTDDLVRGDDVFFAATGVTDGDLLRGVRYWAAAAAPRVDRDAVEVRARSA